MSASANAIKLCLSKQPPNTSYESIHKIAKRATPSQMSTYKHALQLYKLFNSTNMSDDWITLNYQQNFSNRQKYVQINDVSATKIGKNILSNRLGILYNQIDYDWLNLSLNYFKINCKKLYLMNYD